MSTDETKTPQSVSWWITSLAISITCCAVLFVIFAGYLSEIKKSIAAENMQLTQMTLHEERLLSEIQSLHRAIGVAPGTTVATSSGTSLTAPAIMPTTAAPAMPPSATLTPPPATTTTTIPSTTPASAPIVPPAASPTTVPEVPAKN